MSFPEILFFMETKNKKEVVVDYGGAGGAGGAGGT